MGFLLTGSSDVRCPHGGTMRCDSKHSQTHFIDNYPIWVEDDNYRIEGCPIGKFCCREVRWSGGSPTKYLYNSRILIDSSIGSCYDFGSGQTGRAVIVSHQTKVADGE